mgnify:CR=1 FL=1
MAHKRVWLTLNIHVKRGRIYGLLGRNGAGKTTTMKNAVGLNEADFRGGQKSGGKPLQGNEKEIAAPYW